MVMFHGALPLLLRSVRGVSINGLGWHCTTAVVVYSSFLVKRVARILCLVRIVLLASLQQSITTAAAVDVYQSLPLGGGG